MKANFYILYINSIHDKLTILKPVKFKDVNVFVTKFGFYNRNRTHNVALRYQSI